MDFLEKDLEEIIFNADKPDLNDRGLYINGKLFRQLQIGNYGKADLVSIDRVYDQRWQIPEGGKVVPGLSVTVFELKKDKIGISAFLQALGYIKGIASYIGSRNFGFDVDYKIVLIGKKIDKNSTFIYLSDLIPETAFYYSKFLECYTYSYNLNGLEFKNEWGYKLNDEGF